MGNIVNMFQYKQDKEEHELERQHEEFITLISYVVSAQKTKHESIIIDMTTDKLYTIYNYKNEQISYTSMDILFSNAKIEDVLISEMIEYPSKKYTYNGSDCLSESTKETITKIYKDRVEFN